MILTGLYTVLGGMRAVAYTEAVQTAILVLGSAVLTWYGLEAIGGWAGFRAALPSDMFNLWKPLVPAGMEGSWAPVKEAGRIAWYFNGNYPWLGMLFCAPIIGLWYWCTDQYIVQRALGAPNEREARRGAIFASLLKLPPVFIFIIPGMLAVALAVTGKIPALQQSLLDANGHVVNAQAQAAFPLMVQHVLPVGIRGLVVAGLLAALMSSLAGAFNASSTLFTMDFYNRLRPGATQAQLVWIGRVATTVMVLVAIVWIPVIRGARGLYDYLQGVQGYLAPPIFTVFFLGVFFKRLNARRARGARHGLPDGLVPARRGHARHARDGGLRRWLRRRHVPVDRQQHLLPVLQRADLPGVGRGDGGREPPDGSARRGKAEGPHIPRRSAKSTSASRVRAGGAPKSRGPASRWR